MNRIGFVLGLFCLLASATSFAGDQEDLTRAVVNNNVEGARAVYARGTDAKARIALANGLAPGATAIDNKESLLMFSLKRAINEGGKLDAVRFLLMHGANTEAEDSKKRTAIQLIVAMKDKNPKVAAQAYDLLLSYGAMPHSVDTLRNDETFGPLLKKHNLTEGLETGGAQRQRLVNRLTQLESDNHNERFEEGTKHRKEIADRDVTISGLKTDLKVLNEAHDLLTKAKAKLDGEHDLLTKAKAKLDGEHDLLTKAKAKLDGEHDLLTKAKAKLDGEHAELIKAKAKADADILALTKANTKLDTDLKALQGLYAQLGKDKLEVEKELGTTKTNRDALMKEVGDLKTTIAALNKQIEKLNQDLTAAGKLKTAVDKDLSDLKVSNGKLQSAHDLLAKDNSKAKTDHTDRLLETWRMQMQSGLCGDILALLATQKKAVAQGKELEACEQALSAKKLEPQVEQAILRWERVMHDTCNLVIAKEARKPFETTERPRQGSATRLAECQTQIEKQTNPKFDERKSPMHSMMEKAVVALAAIPANIPTAMVCPVVPVVPPAIPIPLAKPDMSVGRSH